MDVHLNNRRYLTTPDNLLIHVALSHDILINYNICVDSNILRLTAQTRWPSGATPSPYNIVWGKFITRPIQGVPGTNNFYVSIPVAVQDGHYDPFAITVLRFSLPSGNVHIPFFHLTLISGLKKATPAPTLIQQPKLAQQAHQTSTFDLLIQKSLAQTTIPQADLDNPLCLLRKLLERKRGDECPRHHQGLENPGAIRGHTNTFPQPNTRPKYMGHKRTIKKGLSKSDLTEFSTSQVNHVFSDNPIYFFCYPTIPDHLPTSIIEEMDNATLTTINPLKVISDELNILYTLNNRYIKTWETYLDGGQPLLEPLCGLTETVIVPPSPKSTFLRAAVTDALYMTYQSYTQINSTITAICAQPREAGCWADIVPLDITSTPTWSLKICQFTLSDPRSLTPNLRTLKYIQRFFTHIYSYVILSDSNLNVWLVLPGGYIVPGYLILNPGEKEFICQRYG
ncbi:viral DNA cleavage/packaging protein [Vombatid gammaherpesvirus 1]|uniref:Viral DNA cleavage/packaging protein n=1 Tax=Vombatid gammaherpesvirus 1 TaxID=2052651 RepID=A0A3S8D7J2_9GAMA|nr:viral DNA cleavage/packaging protein [Vombatid gammaherpesvirus 1]AZB49131.1 viral DNA cleavage/packaging protein [Vombatid gammaherpesvirus 1]